MTLKPSDPEVTLRVVSRAVAQFSLIASWYWVSLATASAMVLARVVSLAPWSWLWSLLASVEVAVASPSLVLSLFPIMLVRGCMVLQEVEVSEITKCS